MIALVGLTVRLTVTVAKLVNEKQALELAQARITLVGAAAADNVILFEGVLAKRAVSAIIVRRDSSDRTRVAACCICGRMCAECVLWPSPRHHLIINSFACAEQELEGPHHHIAQRSAGVASRKAQQYYATGWRHEDHLGDCHRESAPIFTDRHSRLRCGEQD